MPQERRSLYFIKIHAGEEEKKFNTQEVKQQVHDKYRSVMIQERGDLHFIKINEGGRYAGKG
jgi:hypothetical protein